VLLGAVEPGGRLPTTWPAVERDVPVIDVTPKEGVVEYAEGVHIGYRAWLRSGATPAYWFGHGLGYTDIALTGIAGGGRATGDDLATVTVTAQNRGQRDGKQVVQVYAERPDSSVERPVRWLVGFSVVHLAAGATAEVAVGVPTRLLAHWAHGGWQVEPGTYRLRAGTSAVDLPLETTVEVAE
jgi:beta-glucosidase